jgi:hypothetical protein
MSGLKLKLTNHKKLKTKRWVAQDQKNYQYQPLQWKRVKIKQEKK